METEEVILVVMGILLLAWVLYGVIRIFRRIKKAASGITIPAWVQCEKCGAVFAVPAENVMRGGMMKSSRKTQTIIRGGYVVRQPVYKSYAKNVIVKAVETEPGDRHRIWRSFKERYDRYL